MALKLRLNSWGIALGVIGGVGWTIVGVWQMGLVMFANLIWLLWRRDQIIREGG